MTMNLLHLGDDATFTLSDISDTLLTTCVDDLLEISGPSEPCNLDILQQRLQGLLDNAREPWTYAIFWQSKSSIVDYPNSWVLGWGDGYYHGEIDKPNRTSSVTSFAEQEYRKKVLRELNSLTSGSVLEDDAMDEEVNDAEWFFLISMAQSFVNNNELPYQAMLSNQPVWIAGRDQLLGVNWERARQGVDFGMQTIVYIPSRNGVVELGSTELIFQGPDLMNEVRVLFNFNNSQLDKAPMIADQTARGDSDCSKVKCKTTAISLSQEVVEKQFGKPMKEAAKCKTAEISLSLEVVEEQFGKTMKEAAKDLDVSVSTLKRKLRKLGIPEWRGPNFVKRNANDPSIIQINTSKENNGAIQDPSIVNINKNLLTIKAEYANDMNMIKFYLPTSQASYMNVEKVIGKRFKLIIGTYNLKYLDEDGDWICLTSDEEMIDCIKSSTKLDRIVVLLRVVPSL